MFPAAGALSDYFCFLGIKYFLRMVKSAAVRAISAIEKKINPILAMSLD